MIHRMVCAGFGGQGVLTAGKIILYAAYRKGFYATWFPSYGNEMRGGAANCNIIFSDEKIASPYADHPDILICLNSPAVDRFEQAMVPGGTLLVNSTLIEESRVYRNDISVVKAPVTELAQALNSAQNANICMLGKMIKETNIFSLEEFTKSMCDFFENKGKGKFNQKNVEVFMAGYNA